MPRNTAIFAPTFAGEWTVRPDNIRMDPRYGRRPPLQGMSEGHLAVKSYLAVPVVSRGGEVQGGLFFSHHGTAGLNRRACASEALSMLGAAEDRYDAVIIDATLPKRGLALLARLRSVYADVRVLLTTEGAHSTLLKDDLAVLVSKPFSAQIILEVLARLGVKRCRVCQRGLSRP